MEKELQKFAAHLAQEERSTGTIEKYIRDVRHLQNWLDGRTVTRETIGNWRDALLRDGFAPVTINSMLAAVNSFLRFCGREDCRVKSLRIQRRLFRDTTRELTRGEYQRLWETAHAEGKERLALLMESICATGIRVSEVRYLTVEAVRAGRTEISLKGKIRTILLPAKLCRRLLKYAKAQKIASGEIFVTRSGKSLSRWQIWAELKAICKQAGVMASKVFPHNLRHLFARTFYQVTRDVAQLADVMGHSRIETTRIYLVSTGAEHARQMEKLGLLQ